MNQYRHQLFQYETDTRKCKISTY